MLMSVTELFVAHTGSLIKLVANKMVILGASYQFLSSVMYLDDINLMQKQLFVSRKCFCSGRWLEIYTVIQAAHWLLDAV